MERKVSVGKKVNDTLENLVDILFDEDYFNYLEDAVKYVNNISDFIYTIPNKPHRVAPNNVNGHFIYPTNQINIPLGTLVLT
jgi:hypothetical protein